MRLTHINSGNLFYFSSVQLLSCVQLFVTPWTAACQALLSVTNISKINSALLHVLIYMLFLLFSHLVLSDSATPQTAGFRLSLSFTISQSLLKLLSIELVMASNHLILCHPLLLPSVFPSIRVFYSLSALHIRWPKCWSFSFSVSPSYEYSGLIYLRIDWFDPPALLSKGLSRVFSNTTVQKHQFFCTQPSLWPNSHICTWLLEKL